MKYLYILVLSILALSSCQVNLHTSSETKKQDSLHEDVKNNTEFSEKIHTEEVESSEKGNIYKNNEFNFSFRYPNNTTIEVSTGNYINYVTELSSSNGKNKLITIKGDFGKIYIDLPYEKHMVGDTQKYQLTTPLNIGNNDTQATRAYSWDLYAGTLDENDQYIYETGSWELQYTLRGYDIEVSYLPKKPILYRPAHKGIPGLLDMSMKNAPDSIRYKTAEKIIEDILSDIMNSNHTLDK